MTDSKTSTAFSRALAVAIGLLTVAAAPVQAGLTDIATAPLFTTNEKVIKPNVMFVLDDSGSMAWDYMPDVARFGTSGYSSVYGRRAPQCNGLAFDKNKTYDPPVTAAGAAENPASTGFLSGTYVDTASYLSSGDVYNTSSQNRLTGTTSLNIVSSGSVTVTVNSSTVPYYATNGGMIVSFFGSGLDSRGRTVYDSSAYMIGKVTGWDSSTSQLVVEILQSVGSGTINSVYVGVGSPIDNVYYTYSGTIQPALNYSYTSSGVVSDAFYLECSSAIGSTTGKAVFAANLVTSGSADAQNYANWYYFYSTRMRMMKTSLTKAFSSLDERYRVGFMTINENTGGILDVKDFDAAQKTTFYSRVNGADPNNSTPLRAALSKAGRYYAKKITDQSYDPVQYSCQKNFTILSTDGYWNGSAGYQLDGSTAIGQQDGAGVARPMYDGGVNQSTTVRTWTKTETGTRTAVTPRTTVSTVTNRKVETTTTPHTTLTYRKLYKRAINSLNRCGGSGGSCTISVTTTGNHGYASGDSIAVNTSMSAYNGTFTVTVTGSSSFTYTLPSRPSSPSGLTGSVAPASNTCATTGEGQLITTEQTYTATATKTTNTTDTTTTLGTSTTVYNLTRTTPMTQTLTYLDGVLQSDTTSSGSSSLTVGSVVSGPTINDGTPTPTSSDAVSNASSSTTPVTSSGYPSYGSCSTTAAPANTDTAGTGSTTTTGPTQVATTGPTTTNGTTTNTDVTPSSSDGTVTETTTVSNSGGSADSLADVAMYYYKTDLRDSAHGNCTGALGDSVCDNNVKAVGGDVANWQHMSTYTLGLGLSGLLKYKADYETSETGDFKEIKLGNKNWPVPSSDAVANIDDLWHAAVNGRGRYFSASDPTSLSTSLSAALMTIDKDTGNSSAAATSTLQPVEGDNGVYIAQFVSLEWTGDLKSYAMNVKTGEVPTKDASGTDLKGWSASEKLTTAITRNIYYFKPASGNTGTLRAFTYDNLTADGMNGYVDNACSKSPALTQCATASATVLDSINSGSNMVSFLRGQVQTQYRTRAALLGDIVNSSPVYVGKPGFSYTESGYAAFKSTNAARGKTLYVGANDGMLHAFNAGAAADGGGAERWAYMPRLLMDKLYRLGDSGYDSKHQYYVDATPVVGDVYTGTAWKTILVGGLNAGGKGYYALDVTDPNNPVALWEFSDSTRLGYTYGNPIITKRKSGKWVVAFTSGYNNADGKGYLFVVDALTGQLEADVGSGGVITTDAGSAADPSGLGKLNAWVSADTDNTALRFYAGDLLGNIWRFDVDGNLEPANAALKLGQAIKDSVPQPITTAPQLAEIEANGGTHAVVYVGTGRYLGKTDILNAEVQSIYAVKDGLTSTGLGDLRLDGNLVKQAFKDPTATLRELKDDAPVDWSTKNGWYVDLPSTRERINVDMQLAFNTLTAAGNIPGAAATDCDKANDGTSYIYQLNVVSGRGQAKSLSSMVAGLSTVQLPDGTGVTVVTKTDASQPEPVTIDPTSLASAKARRSSWRELID